jgi:hypothetical protein
VWCESTSSTISNCVIIGNSARAWGGGVSSGTLNNCLLASNTAASGGGAGGSTIINCVITGNQAGGGGGVDGCILDRCKITQNSALSYGGGALFGILNNCVLFGNVAGTNGGASGATLNNCTLTGNSAQNGGGAGQSTLNNCILYYNSASSEANYGNSGPIICTLNYCCTSPLPSNGVGNIVAEPQLADFSHIGANSPCRGAGSAVYTSGTDIDGEPWASPPSIGCDEYVFGAITGALEAAISAVVTNVAAGYAISFIGQVTGHASASFWNFGDGLSATNQPYISHSWAAGADYPIIFSAVNESNPGGISATVTVHVVDHPIHYVSLTCTNPTPPYLSWITAATNIQDAVDAAYLGGAVLVSNGVYQTGGRVVYGSLTNRVVINKAVTVQSVNGPSATIIQGYQVPGNITGTAAIRCVYLTNGAVLIGFTLSKGATTRSGDFNKEQSGGGVWFESTNAILSNCVVTANASFYSGGGAYSGTLNSCLITTNMGGAISYASGGGGAIASILNNCVLTSNNAQNYGGGANNCTLNNCSVSNNLSVIGGGGVYQGFAYNSLVLSNHSNSGAGAYLTTLNNCVLANNVATASGGGSFQCTLNNCTLVGNSSNLGGGAYQGIMSNCVTYFNHVGAGSNYFGSTLNYCCTAPIPTGVGNFTNDPGFVNLATFDLHLQSNSPCINAGNNSSVSLTSDLDGNKRIVGGMVDIGAYEYQFPTSIISYAWLQQYGLLTDGSVDYVDSDGDGMNNWQEWKAGTNPTNAASLLWVASPSNSVFGITLTWQSVNTRTYYLQSSTNLPAFTSIQSNLVGQTGSTSYTDITATNGGPYFYRVGVQ